MEPERTERGSGPTGGSITLVALALALVCGGLTVAELRRQGLTEKLDWVPDETPPVAPVPSRPKAPAPRPPLARNLEVFLLDGLRVDTAESLPAWRELAPRGARLRALARFPVYSVPGRSLLVTGAPPEVTGLVGNGRSAGGKIDHLLARAADAGFAVTGARWEDWLGLAPFERRAPAPGTRVLDVEDWFDCDHVAHERGAASEEYHRAALAVSERLLERVRHVDLEHDAVLAVADHGHVDPGGHLGLDPEVATAPALLLGAGVRPGFAQDEPVRLEDVGATACVLLGLESPSLARGVPVTGALTLTPEASTEIVTAFRERRLAVEDAWESAVNPARVVALRALAAALAFASLLRVLRPKLDRALLVASVAPALAATLFATVAPPMSANGGPRWLVPEYFALFAGASLPGLLLGRFLRLEAGSHGRALLVAWAAPALALLVRYGLGPSGLAPSPGSFVLVLDLAFLAFTATAIVGLWIASLLRNAFASPATRSTEGEPACPAPGV